MNNLCSSLKRVYLLSWQMNENREQHILDKLNEEEVPLNNIKLDQVNRIIPKSILIVD